MYKLFSCFSLVRGTATWSVTQLDHIDHPHRARSLHLVEAADMLLERVGCGAEVREHPSQSGNLLVERDRVSVAHTFSPHVDEII